MNLCVQVSQRPTKSKLSNAPIEAEARPVRDLPFDPLVDVLASESILRQLDDQKAILLLRVGLALCLVGVDDVQLLVRMRRTADFPLEKFVELTLCLSCLFGNEDLLRQLLVFCARRLQKIYSVKKKDDGTPSSSV